MSNRRISLNGRSVLYEFERKNVKNINLRIRSDGTVYVSANNRVAEDIIDGFLLKKKNYILSALDKYADIAKYAEVDRNYVTGESFRYFGRDLRLIVIEGKNSIVSDGVYLRLSTQNVHDKMLKERLIDKWYNTQCKKSFNEIITEIYPIFQKYGVQMPKLMLRSMTSRWGSCQPKRGMITLNKRLIEVPRNSIEYVVMHEFVHFLHPNHSAKFYEMLSALMPDWKTRKQMLEKTM